MRFFFEKLVVAYFFGPPCIRSTVSDGVSPSPEDGPEPARPPINLALFSHWFLNRTNLVSCCLTAVLLSFTFNGAGTNLKVGAPVWREAPENFFWSCPSTFLALKVQIVVLVSAFAMVSTVWSVSCFMVPPCPAICKSGGSWGNVPCAVIAGVCNTTCVAIAIFAKFKTYHPIYIYAWLSFLTIRKSYDQLHVIYSWEPVVCVNPKFRRPVVQFF